MPARLHGHIYAAFAVTGMRSDMELSDPRVGAAMLKLCPYSDTPPMEMRLKYSGEGITLKVQQLPPPA